MVGPVLVVTRGLPGSGKSSWGRSCVEVLGEERVLVVERDSVRLELFGRLTGPAGCDAGSVESVVMEVEVSRVVRSRVELGLAGVSWGTCCGCG